MPQQRFVEGFMANPLDLGWGQAEAAARRPHCAALARQLPAVQALQGRMAQLQRRAVLPLAELKAIHRRVAAGELASRQAKQDMPEAKVRQLLKVVKEPISLDQPAGEDGDATMADLVADKLAISPLEVAQQRELQCQVDQLLAGLTAREREVMRLRYGIGMPDDLTLEEVGRRLDLSRNRVREIEAQALHKLRDVGTGHLRAGADTRQ